MKKSEAKRRIEEMQLEMEIENRASNLNRARSVTVGTAFGGTTELIMRSDGGRHIWCIMQPVEVIELIHQLAANVGCNLALKPREDFAAWRDWKVTEQERLHYNGFAPFPNDLIQHQQNGANMAKFQSEQIAAPDPALISTGKQLNESNIIPTPEINEPITEQELLNGSPSIDFDKDGVLINQSFYKDDGTLHTLGGSGGGTTSRVRDLKRKKQG
jgi:hypothetical protein